MNLAQNQLYFIHNNSQNFEVAKVRDSFRILRFVEVFFQKKAFHDSISKNFALPVTSLKTNINF